MIKVLRKASEYSLDEFKKYCEINGVDFRYYIQYARQWAIQTHEIDLKRFIRLAGSETPITVSGVLYLDNKSYKVLDRKLTLSKAFEEMLTPDTQDFCVSLNDKGTYYVITIHNRGRNMFKFRLNDKD